MRHRYIMPERGCEQVRLLPFMVIFTADTHFPYRAAARQLSDRCTQMLEAIRDESQSGAWPSGKLEESVRQAEMCVLIIIPFS
jgi:hypothetical protein